MKKYKINNFSESLYYEELDNGLKVYIVPIKSQKKFSSMLVTKYGGRDTSFMIDNEKYETPTGIAHFLEHKMFEREDDPFTFYGKFGTDVNAATSYDYTCYYFIGNKCFNKSLKYLLNWIQNLNINDEQVEKEKGIILEEASMYKDNPSRVMYDKQKENIFVNDPKKYKVIGTDEDIKRITKEELDLCYNTFYDPNNMYLIVTGNVKPNDVIKIVKENTKNFQKSSVKIKQIYNKEPDRVEKDFEEIHMNIGIPKVSVSYKINKNCFKDIDVTPFELDLYLHFLINISLGVTSEIKNMWMEKDLLSDSFYRIDEIESHYIIELIANSTNPNELINELEKYILNLKIDKNSFEREKKIWIAGEIKSIEDSVTMLYNVLDDLLDYGEFIPNKISYIKNLDYDKLIKIKNKLSFDNKSIIKIMPINMYNNKLDQLL